MLLRNYDNIMTRLRLPTPNVGIYQNGNFTDDTKLNIKQPNGQVTPASGNYASFSFNVPFAKWGTAVNTSGTSWLYAGASNLDCYGNVGVHYDDYKLTSFDVDPSSLSDSISISTPLFDAENKCWYQIRKQSYMANSDIIIKEIGVSNGSTNSSLNYIGNPGKNTAPLVYREVLETPIEVKNGQIYTISLTIKSSILDNKNFIITQWKIHCAGGKSIPVETIRALAEKYLTLVEQEELFNEVKE